MFTFTVAQQPAPSLITAATYIPHRVQTRKSAVSRPKRYRSSSSGWWTVITTRPLGSEVVRAPCLRQNEQVSARSESSSGRTLVSSASSRLPQWQRPVSGASLRGVPWPLALDLAPVPPREVDDLELHPVRVGEEDRVILRAVLGVLRRRIEDRDPLAHEEIVEAIHLVPAPHAEREVVEADAVAVERRCAIPRAKSDAEVSVGPRDVRRVRHAPEAEGAEHLLVEGNRAREVVDGEIDVVQAEDVHRCLSGHVSNPPQSGSPARPSRARSGHRPGDLPSANRRSSSRGPSQRRERRRVDRAPRPAAARASGELGSRRPARPGSPPRRESLHGVGRWAVSPARAGGTGERARCALPRPGRARPRDRARAAGRTALRTSWTFWALSRRLRARDRSWRRRPGRNSRSLVGPGCQAPNRAASRPRRAVRRQPA